MTIHVIIKEERRSAPRALALQINNDLRTPAGVDGNGMPIYTTTLRQPQLHTQGAVINDLANIDYAAEWDGVSPWITVIAGDRAALKMRYMGWPELTREEWEAAHPPATP